MVNYWICGKT